MGFASESRKDSQMYKFVGTLSFHRLQTAALISWLRRDRCSNLVYVRMFDDTNVWVSPQKKPGTDDQAEAAEVEPEDDDENQQEDRAGQSNNSGKAGRQHVAQVLQMCQYISVRRGAVSDQPRAARLDSVKVLSPYQVLPKAGGRDGWDDDSDQ